MKYGLSWSTSDGLVHVGEQALAWILHQPAFLKNQAGAKFRLEQSWRPVKDAEINAIPDSTDGKWVNTTIGTMEMLSALGLVKFPDKPEHKKPGRPRKQKLEFVGPKRPRGRPRKVTPAASSAATPA